VAEFRASMRHLRIAEREEAQKIEKRLLQVLDQGRQNERAGKVSLKRGSQVQHAKAGLKEERDEERGVWVMEKSGKRNRNRLLGCILSQKVKQTHESGATKEAFMFVKVSLKQLRRWRRSSRTRRDDLI
jgi:hypothetical protein